MTVCNLVMQRGPSKNMSWVRSSTVKFAENVFTGSYSEQKSATDALGTFALTLTNIIPGSAVQVESGSTVFHFSIAASDTLLINLQAYAAGSPLNALTIKVRKGSEAPYYQPYRTQTTAIVGAQSIFVSQIEDQ